MHLRRALFYRLHQRVRLGLGDDEAVEMLWRVYPVSVYRTAYLLPEVAHLLPEGFVLFDGAA
jgi:hypothetical protein